MAIVKNLAQYQDDNGNRIDYDGVKETGIQITFRGANNRLVIDAEAKLGTFRVDFDCDHGYLKIGGNDGVPALSGTFRVGQDAKVIIGRNVSTTTGIYVSSVEGNTVTVGEDVMFASGIELRGDDGHPIFDIRSEKRVNTSKPITIGNHVWIGGRAILLGGATIDDGSVIGTGSIVKGKIPNNTVAVGSPARVVRKDIAWERPHLSLAKPFYKPDASTVAKSQYWNLTEDPDQTGEVTPRQRLLNARRRAWHFRSRLFKRR